MFNKFIEYPLNTKNYVRAGNAVANKPEYSEKNPSPVNKASQDKDIDVITN